MATPIQTVAPGVTGAIRQVLARTEQPLTGVGIAELTDGRASRPGVNKALKGLVSSGLVECRPAGAAKLYRLNRHHVAADAVVALSDLRAEALRRIGELVTSWPVQPDGVWLFGSAARGDGNVNSDLDLLVLRPAPLREDDTTWSEQTMELAQQVRAWTGNACEILEYSPDELAALARHKDPLVDELLRDAVSLAGAPLRELIGRRR